MFQLLNVNYTIDGSKWKETRILADSSQKCDLKKTAQDFILCQYTIDVIANIEYTNNWPQLHIGNT